jgi:hypothetical protein
MDQPNSVKQLLNSGFSLFIVDVLGELVVVQRKDGELSTYWPLGDWIRNHHVKPSPPPRAPKIPKTPSVLSHAGHQSLNGVPYVSLEMPRAEQS